MIKKERKGITLIALVVTIVILLILVGISIASLTGNGLFEKAKLAKEKQEESQKLENTILSSYEEMIEGNSRENKNYNIDIYDEWTTWLYLAGIENPEKYNQQDILSNEDLMDKVLNNDKAVEYMLKSNYFILPGISRSEVAMNKISNSKKVKYKVLSNENCYNIIKDSPYYSNMLRNSDRIPNMTSNNSPLGKVTFSSAATYGSYYMDGYLALDGENKGGWDFWCPTWGNLRILNV